MDASDRDATVHREVARGFDSCNICVASTL